MNTATEEFVDVEHLTCSTVDGRIAELSNQHIDIELALRDSSDYNHNRIVTIGNDIIG